MTAVAFKIALDFLIKFWREIVIGILLIIIVGKDASYSKLETKFLTTQLNGEKENLARAESENRKLIEAYDKLNETERRLSEIAVELSDKETKILTITETKYRELQPIINNLSDGCFSDEWLLRQNETISAYRDTNTVSKD